MVTGFRRVLEFGATIAVKIDGDGQMDPGSLPDFARSFYGVADYTKGNRFYDLRSLESMPKIRLFGNTGLSFMAKRAMVVIGELKRASTTGYWAIHRSALSLYTAQRLARDYFFETDLLFRLNTVRAVVRDVPMKAVYADGRRAVFALAACFFSFRRVSSLIPKRLFYTYILRDFIHRDPRRPSRCSADAFCVVFGLIHWEETPGAPGSRPLWEQ